MRFPSIWSAKIGLVVCVNDTTCEPEFNEIVPKNIACFAARIPFPQEVTVEGLIQLYDNVDECAKQLAWVYPDVVCFCCTSGSLINGLGYDQRIINKIETAAGTKGTTTATAVVEALRDLEIKTVSIATPYSEEINVRERYFLENLGFKTARMEGLGITSTEEMCNVKAETIYQLAKRVDTPESDCVFISCTGLRANAVIEKLEEELDKPVFSSNTASVWNCLKKANVEGPIRGFGELLKHL